MTPVWNDISREMHNTAPVWRRGVEARFHGSKLTMLGVDVHLMFDEGAEISPVEVEASEALLAAIQTVSPDVFHWGTQADLVWLPLNNTVVEHPKGMDARLVWEVRWETQTPRGKWVAFVDAETRKVWNVYNEVRYLDGTLHAEHDIRTIGDGLTVSPLSELNVLGEEYRTDS